jgi:hypothetical protein
LNVFLGDAKRDNYGFNLRIYAPINEHIMEVAFKYEVVLIPIHDDEQYA